MIVACALGMVAQGQTGTDEEGTVSEFESITTENRKGRDVQTLFRDVRVTGAHVAFSNKISELNGQLGYFTGGQLMMGFNHDLNIGFGFYGLVSDIQSNYIDIDGFNNYLYEYSYGGLIIEPVIMDEKLVHVTVPVLLGAGGALVTQHRFYDYHFWSDLNPSPGTIFFVAEPGVMAQLNITRWMRVAVGGHYRAALGSGLPNTRDWQNSGFGGNFVVKLGWF